MVIRLKEVNKEHKIDHGYDGQNYIIRISNSHHKFIKEDRRTYEAYVRRCAVYDLEPIPEVKEI